MQQTSSVELGAYTIDDWDAAGLGLGKPQLIAGRGRGGEGGVRRGAPGGTECVHADGDGVLCGAHTLRDVDGGHGGQSATQAVPCAPPPLAHSHPICCSSLKGCWFVAATHEMCLFALMADTCLKREQSKIRTYQQML